MALGMNDLHHLAVDHAKACPQDFMAPQNLVYCSIQQRPIQAAMQSRCQWNVEGRIARFDLVKQPETALGHRRRKNEYIFARGTVGVIPIEVGGHWLAFG